jgi:hypothetical protein
LLNLVLPPDLACSWTWPIPGPGLSPDPACPRTRLPTWQNSQVQVSEEPLICSARGCRAPAVHALRWNNPKLHPPERRKTWLACDTHLTSLGDFLRARNFLREVEPVPSA